MDESGLTMVVDFGELFRKEFNNYLEADQQKIFAFVKHVREFGLENLEGRNKPSSNVDTNDPNFLNKVRYATDNKLYHYHIGIPNYTLSPKGDKTSKYVLHYVLVDVNTIKIVDMSEHPPFKMPSEKHLT